MTEFRIFNYGLSGYKLLMVSETAHNPDETIHTSGNYMDTLRM